MALLFYSAAAGLRGAAESDFDNYMNCHGVKDKDVN